MGEGGNYDIWGLSLSLRPPVNPLHRSHKFKRESDSFIADKQCSKVQKPYTRTMMMPRMEVKVKSPLVIDVDEMEISKSGSPNSALSSATGKRVAGFTGEKDTISNDEEGGSGGGGSSGGERGERKKLRLSKEQIMVLEHAFKEHTTLNTKQKVALARQVNLRPRQVEVWFQNRRARTKLKQTEVDCEYLRRFCETLTEQNRLLQKEVQELRALKASADQSVTHGNHPPTTLSMCASCQSVALTSSASTRTTTSETNCYLADVLHRPVPLNLKKLSLTINNNRMSDSHHPVDNCRLSHQKDI